MTLATLGKYLIGDRAAILCIANTPRAVWVGALLVLSAGLAREYDNADLVHEPWRLAIPFCASLVTSFLLYRLIYFVARRPVGELQPSIPDFDSFLTLYWMTAPLAWLYALPVERFLSAADATRANLCLLAVVALWRVLLITRVTQVLFALSIVGAFSLVMLFADTIVLAIAYNTPITPFAPEPAPVNPESVVRVMGGIADSIAIPPSESELLIHDVVLWIRFAGLVSWPVWFFGTWFGARKTNRIGVRQESPAAEAIPTAIRPSVWNVVIVSIAAGGLLLLLGEPELRPYDAALAAATVWVSWLIWHVGARVRTARRPNESALLADDHTPMGVAWPVWALTAIAIGAWAFVLPHTQPEQQLRLAVEKRLTERQIRDALDLMSAHQQADFPPHWSSPPHVTMPDSRPQLDSVQRVLRPDDAPWVQRVFNEKAGKELDNVTGGW